MISILIPFRSDLGPRDRLFNWVGHWWSAAFPAAEVCVGDVDSQLVFHRGLARNDAFSISDGDILIVADADTVPSAPAVAEAVRQLLQLEAYWVIPYSEDRYYNLTSDLTEQVLTSAPTPAGVPEPTWPGDWEHKITSWAGCLVLPRAAWDAVGGYDSRFLGWGYEDNAFRLALDTMWGPHSRVDGHCCHLWHPISDRTNFDQPYIGHNRDLYRRYQDAAGSRSAMKELLEP